LQNHHNMNNNFLEELKAYLVSTPKDKVLQDWSESTMDSNTNILVEDFIGGHYSFNFKSAPPNEGQEWITNSFTNLKETSGFCFL